ncbi:MAG TPA: VOC family protein [Amycolatopsis sp.]|uniref:VOC family protein n=1 Tax=Amycolatopsis sp. TaxID=37632 RepID=UPI002B4A4A7C|nr:VOC family protein [Amycolatopsis sp.]HKS43930.1 VOC family protein [Amycolatopsis sp.]
MLGSVPATRSLLPSGLPCWVELATADENAAQAFYGGLFGWTYRAIRHPATRNGRYLLASLDDADVGGLYLAEPGQRSAWTINVAVRNTINAAEWVEHLGGEVTRAPVSIPHHGSILRASDPGGTPVVFWQPPETWDFASGEPNTFSGADLNTRDGTAADHFFCRLFNYTAVQIGDHHGIDYMEWRLGNQPVLYRYVMGPEYPPDTPPHWMVYFQVHPDRGTDAATEHALLLGGSVVVNPYDTPWGRIAILADPAGATFSIIDHSVTLDDWGRAEVDDPYDD